MEYVIETRQLPEQAVICIRGRVAQAEIPAFMQQSYETLFGYLTRLGVRPAGPPFAIYHAFEPHDIDTEVCVPTPSLVRPAGDIGAHALPAVIVARTLHVGPYVGLVHAYAAVTDWIRDNGWQAVGPVREEYLTGPDVPPADYRTQVGIPIERAVDATR